MFPPESMKCGVNRALEPALLLKVHCVVTFHNDSNDGGTALLYYLSKETDEINEVLTCRYCVLLALIQDLWRTTDQFVFSWRDNNADMWRAVRCSKRSDSREAWGDWRIAQSY